MAFWGAPQPNLDHAAFACKTALYCKAYVDEFNDRCLAEGKPFLKTRFGISSGLVVVGNIGTMERMNYTVIGDAVNTAARLQITDKIYHVSIIISEEVYSQTHQEFLVRPLDTIEVRGKKAKIKIYELIASLTLDGKIGATDSQKKLCADFSAAYQQFSEGNTIAAKQSFEQILKEFPEDYPTQIYLERLNSST